MELALAVSEAAVWAWDAVTDQPVVDDNLKKLFGFASTDSPKLEDFLERMHEEDRDRVAAAIRESLATGGPYREEYRIVLPSGEIRWLRAIGETQLDGQGNFRDFSGVVSDSTDRKLRELEIVDREAHLRRVIDSMLNFVGELDCDGTLLEANKTALESGGLRREDVVGKPFWECYWWSHDEQVVARLKDAVAQARSGQIVRYDVEVRMAGDSRITIDFMLAPVFDDAGNVTNLIPSGVDITEQREFEESLEAARREAQAANQAKSEFLANMSHEIRTPMTAILGYAEILEESVSGDEERQYLRTIRRNGDFLLGIINDILDLSKIEAGKLEIGREPFAPHAVVEDVCSMMEVRAAAKDLTLAVDYRGDIPAQIQSDPKRLKQILINLVGNAIKFTKQGGVTIVVEMAADAPRRLNFTVVDTGIGVSPSRQQQLFEPFAQGDASVTREFGGTGLGLTISRRLARLLGGEIRLDSQQGKGSSFTLQVATGNLEETPLIPAAQPERKSPAAADAIDPIELPDCRILLVDDRREVRFLSKRILAKAGAEIIEAGDGLEAIEAVANAESRGETIDMILLDMQMPNLDGYQAAMRLRNQGFANPIVALTADAMQEDMKRCIECGCNDYLCKPIDVQRLLEVVHRFTATGSLQTKD